MRRGFQLKHFLFSLAVAGLTLAFSATSGAQTLGTSGRTTATNSSSGSGPMPPPPPPLVLTNPAPGAVPQFPAFSAQPTTAEIKAARVFEEPLVPVGDAPSQSENDDLAKTLTAFASRMTADDFSALEDYLANEPDSPWHASMLFNLGWEYYNTGYYSKTLTTWQAAWDELQAVSSGAAKQLADRCVGELAKMHARIGDADALETIFDEVRDRPLTGSASELMAGARQALWLMKNRPEIAYRCGPLALRNLSKLVASAAGVDVDGVVLDSASTAGKGFSLAQLQKLSQDLHLNLQVAQREAGAPIIVPSVVHWQVGHYAAILQQQGDRFFVVDPTFGVSRWISQQAIDAEASGYFLVPDGTLSNHWRTVTQAVAQTVWGRGVTGDSDPGATTPYDEMADPECDSRGMAIYNMHLLLVSLHIEDTPVAFTPPRGPAINLTVTYNQREANQPANFNYSNFGEKWTCNWFSHLTDNGTNAPGDVQYYVAGGGTETFTYNPATTNFNIQWRDQAVLTRLSLTNYQMAFPDGSRRIFGQPNGSTGNSRKIFLTQVIDPTGYTNLLNYDADLRLVSVTDPQANATNLTFYYAVSGGFSPVDIYKVQQVTDRYGRSAVFTYANNELQTMTDVLGLTSQVAYDSSFVRALQTPYGTSTFAYGESGGVRWLEATDPHGSKSRVEFNQSNAIGIPNSDPGTRVPAAAGFYTRNYFLYGRNTFYWDKRAMREAPGDYAKARVYHWLHNDNLASAVGAVESYKEPLENRVWLNYPGQSSDAGATIYGTLNLPSAVGRVLDDGQSQLYRFYRNSLGKITNAVDPVGQNFTFLYATNQIDLLQVRQTVGTNNELLAAFTYNAQHLPLTASDAAGQTNRYGYNAYGQVAAITNALSQVTLFNHSASGNLTSIDGPTNNDTVYLGYDAFDRVNAITNADGYWMKIAYDAFDRPVTNTYPDGTTETLAYQYLDPQTYKDRAGKVTQFTFDSLRHLTRITEATNWNTYFDWCDCGDLSSVTDPAGQVTRWIRDLQGRVTAKEYADGSAVHYGYEQTTSRVKTFTNERNQIRTYSYYLNGLLEQVVYADPTVTPTVAFDYDNYGRVTAMYDGYGSLFGKPTTFTYYPITATPALGAGRLKSIVDPNGLDTLTYAYDALGRVQSVVMTNTLVGGVFGPDVYRHTYTYDVLGRVTQDATKAVGTFNFNYVGTSARLASIIYPSSLTTTFGYYDITGDLRLKGLTNFNGGTVLSRFNYAYDRSGRITNLVQKLGTAAITTNQYAYDAIGELMSVLTNGSSGYHYTYDPAGNRTLEQQGASAWRAWFNPLNEITGKDRGLSVTNRGYQWDEENRLVSVTEGSAKARIIYNGFGRPAFLTEYNNGMATMSHWYVWDGDKVAEESYADTNASNNAYFHWYYDYGHYDTYGPTYYYTTRDALGSVREYYGAAVGQVVKEYDYDPYGRQTTVVDGFIYLGNHFFYTTPPESGFAGMLGMPGHNLDLAQNRVYDPDLGRWLSRDPLGEASGLNLYAYADNDPINNVDPSGLCPVSIPLDNAGSGGGNRPPRPPRVANSAGADEEGEGWELQNLTAAGSIPNPVAGEDLFVGLYGQSRNANIQSGLNVTHTPHHVIQDAVSGTSRNLGATINIRKDLHTLTRTYGRNADLGSNVRNLAADVRDLRNILRDAGYDRSLINQQMQRLIELNRQIGNIPP
jgi:RHS repeat-associated protein